jgi:hypothetical protein
MNCEECSICYYSLDTYITTKCCRQLIHKSCLATCLSINNRCPFCRYSDIKYSKKLNISGNYYFYDFVSVGIMILLLFFTLLDIECMRKIIYIFT